MIADTEQGATAMPWLDWLSRVLGTRQWVVAARLTPRLQDRGYDFALSPHRYQALARGYEADRSSVWGPWLPASGYTSAAGRPLWRLCRSLKTNPARFETMTATNGQPVLLRTYDAARARALMANSA